MIILATLFVGVWFFWTEWRPVNIRKNCNWIERSEWQPTSQEDLTPKLVKKWWARASEREYDSCLRENGLK